MNNLIRLFLIVVILGSMISIGSSCADESDCSMSGRPMMYCKLYTIDPDTRKVRNDTIDSLTITALGTDSIILNNQKKVHTLMLPLRYTADTTAFILKYDPKRAPQYTDTLYIVQKNMPYFQSIECGYLMRQNIVRASFRNGARNSLQKNRVDSLHILNKEANTNEIQNLQIFYKFYDKVNATN